MYARPQMKKGRRAHTGVPPYEKNEAGRKAPAVENAASIARFHSGCQPYPRLQAHFHVHIGVL